MYFSAIPLDSTAWSINDNNQIKTCEMFFFFFFFFFLISALIMTTAVTHQNCQLLLNNIRFWSDIRIFYKRRQGSETDTIISQEWVGKT